jgi:hypothetical protein
MINVKILNRSGPRPSLYASRDFERPPISFGRDSTCSVVLDDPHKHISRFHVEIEEVDGVYWMGVTSKVNPVMVAGRRYGPGTRLVLKSRAPWIRLLHRWATARCCACSPPDRSRRPHRNPHLHLRLPRLPWR